MMKSIVYRSLFIVPLFLMTLFSSVQAKTIYVTSVLDNGSGTLRAALADNTNDTIVIDVHGTLLLDSALTLLKDVVILGPSPTHFKIDLSGLTNPIGMFNFGGKKLKLSGVEIKAASKGVFIISGANATQSLIVSHCLFTENKTDVGSGGLLNLTNASSLVKFISCSFWGNESTATGGAFYVNKGEVKVYNSTFYGNKSGAAGGGAIYAFQGVVEAINNTFYDNIVPGPIPGEDIKVGSSVTLTIKNNIFYNSSSLVVNVDVAPSSALWTGNFSSGASILNTASIPVISNSTNINLNPTPITDGFGLKYFVFNDHNSDCIDVDNSTPVEIYDARGSWRKMYGRANINGGQYLGQYAIDAGAIEYSPLRVVNSLSNGIGSVKDVFDAINNSFVMGNLPGKKTIVFEILSSANQVHNINLASVSLSVPSFLAATDELIINGYSQNHSKVAGPGTSVGTVTPAFIPVQLNGGNGNGAKVAIGASNVSVSGLSIVNTVGAATLRGVAIKVDNSANEVNIEGCHIGVVANGNSVLANDYGIYSLSNTTNVGVPYLFKNYNHVSRNIITGNDSINVFLGGGKVAKNFIGLLADGTSPSNSTPLGVKFLDGYDNLLGGIDYHSANYFGKLDTAVSLTSGIVNHNYFGFEYDLTTSSNIDIGINTFFGMGSTPLIEIKNNYFGNIASNAINTRTDYTKIRGNTIGLTPKNRLQASIGSSGIQVDCAAVTSGGTTAVYNAIGLDQYTPNPTQANIILNCENGITFNLVDYLDPLNIADLPVPSTEPAKINCYIKGNYIGRDTASANLTASYGNTVGIKINDSIQGITIDSNLIAKNGRGIVLNPNSETEGVYITQNSIFENGGTAGLGIDLDDNNTVDTSSTSLPISNEGMIPPKILDVLYCAADSTTRVKLSVYIPSIISVNYKLELYKADVDHQEGKELKKIEFLPTPTAIGWDTLDFSYTSANTSGDYILGTFTQIDYDANLTSTSEFSPAFEIKDITPTFAFLNSPMCDDGISNSLTVSGYGSASYLWSVSGQGSLISAVDSVVSFNSLSSGIINFGLKVTKIGCVIDTSDSVVVNSAPSFDMAYTNVTCKGGSTGSASIENLTGNPTFSYVWSDDLGVVISTATDSIINNLVAGGYSAVVTDANGCSTQGETIYITEPSDSLIVTITHTAALCNGGNGSITASATGGTGTPSYAWSNLETSPNISGVAGIYTVVVADTNGCKDSIVGTITEPPAIIISTTQDSAICNGDNGLLAASATGGTGTLSYSWSNSNTNDTIVTSAGTYSVTVTDANGCSVTKTDSILQPAVITNSINASICQGDSYPFGTQDCSNTGSYTEIFLTVNGCDSVVTLILTVLQSTTATLDTVQCGGSYEVPSGDETYTLTGNYNDTIPNSVGCDSIIIINLTINQPSTGTDVQTACGSYTWIDGITYTADNNTATDTLTNASGCDSIVTLNLTINPLPTFTSNITDVTCNGLANGEVKFDNASGFGQLAFSVFEPGNQPGSSLNPTTGLTAGSYIMKLTDDNGCFYSENAIVTEPSPITITTDVTEKANCNQANGEISVLSSAGGNGPNYEYSIDNVVYTSNTVFSNLYMGSYKVYVKDGQNCLDSSLFIIVDQSSLLKPSKPLFNDAVLLLCEGLTMDLKDLESTNVGLPHTYYFSPNNYLGGDTLDVISLNSNIYANADSIYVFVDNGCYSDTTGLAIKSIYKNNKITTSTTEICEGDILTFEVDNINYDNIIWKVNNTSDDVTAQDEITIPNADTGLYYFYIYKSGCTFKDSIPVSLSNECNNEITTNAFGPGGLDENRTFIIDLAIIDKATDVAVTIYNRWGDIIYKVADYDNSTNAWDGKNNQGEMMPEGTYFYVLESPSFKFTTSGWVYLDLK